MIAIQLVQPAADRRPAAPAERAPTAEQDGLRQRVASTQALIESLCGAHTSGGARRRFATAARALTEALEEYDAAVADLRNRNEALECARARAEQERLRFRDLFDRAPDAYVVTDVHGVVRQANRLASELFGVPHPAMEGRCLTDLITPDDRSVFREHLGRLAGGAALDDWQTSMTREGEVVPIAVDAIPAVTGEVVHEIRWLVRDSTERVRVHQMLRSAFRRTMSDRDRLQDLDAWKSAFIAAAGHDLRAPLVSIGTRAAALRTAAATATVRDGLEQIVDESEDLLALLSDLLDLDRFTRGAVRLRDERVDLVAIARDSVEQAQVSSHDVTLALQPAVVRAEPLRVRQIVTNLLRNAVQHTPPGTAVRVLVRPADDGAVIVVEDSGPGLPGSPDHHQIFAPFVSARRHPKGTPGTGIGLSLVALFAQLHGGRAWAMPRPGGGARFTVFLPSDPRSREGDADGPSAADPGSRRAA